MIVGDIGQSILEEYLLIRFAQCTGSLGDSGKLLKLGACEPIDW